MIVNRELTEKSPIIKAIVDRVDSAWPNDVALLVCYGSFVSGRQRPLSDIDFYFIPSTDRAFALCCQFIINDIGYDLWPVEWQRLEKFANLDDSFASLLADGVVVWAADDASGRRFAELQQRLHANLARQDLTINVAQRSLQTAKAGYFDLAFGNDSLWRSAAIKLVEQLLFALACINGVYLKKGIGNLARELAEMSRVPETFASCYRALAGSANREAGLLLLRDMIDSCSQLVSPDRQAASPTAFNPHDLAGFYEEFKSIYNKLLQACEDRDLLMAYHAASVVDRETQEQLQGLAKNLSFPSLLDLIPAEDFDRLRSACIEHEKLLLRMLAEHKVAVRRFVSVDDFAVFFGGL